MTPLKNKLSQKVEILEADSHKNTENTSSNTFESTDNLIVLKPSESNNLISVVPNFAVTINDAKERIAMLQKFVKEMMIPNVDYGLIPKCDKPSLFKAGAEKLSDIFGFSKQVEILNRIEDWEKGLFHYEVKIILINKKSGLIEAEGVGSCNSKEKKYKYQDSYSIINTILKMAKKRALIDAVLSATRSSGIFTQDMEDFNENQVDSPAAINEEVKSNSSKNTKANSKNINNEHTLITKEQQSRIFSLIAEKQLPVNEIKSLMIQRYNITESKLLSSSQANDFISLLNVYSVF
ncbi:hypothetical protein [Clostridium thailandense]|uniref:hypothetical protein n=1 Tax=Clostridium thailandense TaxID=2794346 RepID=UPI003989DEFF